MTRPWQTLATVETPDGPLELRRRGTRDFLIISGRRVLMTSAAHRSEDALASLTLASLRRHAAPRVLVGGLGMGFTLRAALDRLPADAKVVVAELHGAVVDWCRGPLAALTGGAVFDPRVAVQVTDVAAAIAAAPTGGLDAILLDLDEGPYRAGHGVYGAAGLAAARAALAPGAALGVWSEDADPTFPPRLAAAGFAVATHRAGGGGRRHVIYVGRA